MNPRLTIRYGFGRADTARIIRDFWRRQAQAYTDQYDLASARQCRHEWALADIELSLELGRIPQ